MTQGDFDQRPLEAVPTFGRLAALAEVVVNDLNAVARPNAGTPTKRDGRWMWPHSAESMAARLPELIKAGATMVGGRCGTTPEHWKRHRGSQAGDWTARMGERREFEFGSRGRLGVCGWDEVADADPLPLAVGPAVGRSAGTSLQERQMKKSLLFAYVVLLLASPATSRAEVIVSIQQVGGDVVATGSGSIDTTDLTFSGNTNNAALVWAGFPLGSFAVVGGTTIVPEDVYTDITGPLSFGSGDQFFATSGSGDVFGVVANNVLDLPHGYISGSPLSATSTWSGESFSSLGLTPGSYTWTWGTGAHADSFTLDIGVAAPVPEPSTLTMALFAGLAGIGARLWSRRGAVRG